MTGIIVSNPPTVELPPGSTSGGSAVLPGVTYAYALLAVPQTWTAKQTFPLGNISVQYGDVVGLAASATVDTTNASNITSGTLSAAVMPALTGDVTTTSGTVATSIGATKVTSAMLNADVFSTAHSWGGTQTFVAPILGAAAATSINKVTITAPATSSTLTIANGKTLTANNSLTLAGTDATVLTFPTTSATIARTDAGQTFTGTQAFGALTATTINGNTITAGTYTLTGAASKTLTFSNTLTLAGTDGTAMTFPGTSATIARTDAGQTFTGTQTVGGLLATSAATGVGYTTGSGGAVTQLTSRTTGVTLNNATGAITLFSTAGLTGAWTAFTVTNSSVGATDIPHVAVKSSSNTYITHVTGVTAGSFTINFISIAGTATDSPVINFVILKGSVT